MQFQKASMFKRLGAAMMDFCLVIILGMLFSSFVCSPIANSITDVTEKSYAYNEELFDLGYLVIGKYNNDNKLEIYAYFDSENNNAELKKTVKENKKEYAYSLLNTGGFNVDNATYEKHLTHFYTEINALKSYNNLKKTKSDLFVKNNEGNYVLKDEVQNNETLKNSLHSFYVDTYEKLLNDKEVYSAIKNYKDGTIIKLANRINMINQICVYISLFIGVTILYLVFPLIFKNGQTLGKKLMGVKVVNKKDGSQVNFVTIIIRFFAFAVIEFFLSIALNIFYLPIIISLIIMLINKQGQSLHDLLARTIVVDSVTYQMYRDEPNNGAIEVEAEVKEAANNDATESDIEINKDLTNEEQKNHNYIEKNDDNIHNETKESND